jgi:hypothetical protein
MYPSKGCHGYQCAERLMMKIVFALLFIHTPQDPGKPLYMSVMKMYGFLAKNPK